MGLLLTFFGFFMAILANMTGIEGGMIFVPLFILLFGLSPQEAAGVSMATMVFGLGAGSLAYARQGRIDGRLGLALLVVSLPGTILGALLTPHLSARALELLLGLLLVPLGFRIILRREPDKAGPAGQKSSEGWRRVWRDRGGTEFRYVVRRLPLGLLIYLFVGLVAGLLGIGGGAIKVPTLILLLGLPPHIAVATSVFTMAWTALAGGLAHGAIGHVLPIYVLYLVPGVLLGSQVGARLARRVPAATLMKLLGGMVVLIGLTILAKASGLWD
ncbi:MAG: sulfite exporter TauE/SafE family protein [Nitrospinae bacterium]|nr:sulfite exporter TauE/SafE family protein [Nitrospinota bacterium]